MAVKIAVLVLLAGLSLLLLVIGVLIRYFKWYWMIAGYNTAPPEEQQRYDIAGLSRVVGNGLFVLAGLVLAGGIFQYLEYEDAFTGVMVGLILPVAYIVIKGRRFGPDSGKPPELGG